MTTSKQTSCDWCKSMNEPHALICAACGAPLDMRGHASGSGWGEAPRLRDMSKIRFGKSTCQIEGTYVPVADIRLAREESVYFAHHIFLWKDDRVTMGGKVMPDTWKQEFSGMSLIMMQADGPGHIALSKDEPGEIIALPLRSGQSVYVREHVFMVASSEVSYDWLNPQIWYGTKAAGGDELHWPLGQFLDRFYTEDASGLLLLHGAGNVFVRDLADGESVLVKSTGFLFADVSVQMKLHIERPEGGKPHLGWRGQRHIWLRLTGPGRVAIQSAFKRLEEDDNGKQVVRSADATRQDW